MDTLELATISALSSAVSTLLVGVSAFLVWRQIRQTHEWNRRKTSQEVLKDLVLGEFPQLKDEIVKEFGADYNDPGKSYGILKENLNEVRQVALEALALRQINILESIAINIEKDIIDEDICYEYLGQIVVVVRKWAAALIDDRRKRAGGDLRVFEHLTLLADRWGDKMKRDKRL